SSDDCASAGHPVRAEKRCGRAPGFARHRAVLLRRLLLLHRLSRGSATAVHRRSIYGEARRRLSYEHAEGNGIDLGILLPRRVSIAARRHYAPDADLLLSLPPQALLVSSPAGNLSANSYHLFTSSLYSRFIRRLLARRARIPVLPSSGGSLGAM